MGPDDIPAWVRNCAGACADLARMNDTTELTNDTELNDSDLALVTGGAGLHVRVVDPTPTLDEETLRELHEKLNQGRVFAV